jgi:hypothetical protein
LFVKEFQNTLGLLRAKFAGPKTITWNIAKAAVKSSSPVIPIVAFFKDQLKRLSK